MISQISISYTLVFVRWIHYSRTFMLAIKRAFTLRVVQRSKAVPISTPSALHIGDIIGLFLCCTHSCAGAKQDYACQ